MTQPQPAVRVIPYDCEYERRIREEFSDPPPLPDASEQINPGCYLTKPKRSSDA